MADSAELERLELELEKTKLELQKQQMSVQQSYVTEAEHWLSEAASLRDPDKEDWIQIGPDLTSADGRTVGTEELKDIRCRCRKMGQERPTGRGLIRTFQKYVVSSQGLKLQISNVPEAVEDVIIDRWKEWKRDHQWRQHQLEAVKRLVTDGEIIVNHQVLDGELAPKFLNPDYIHDPTGEHTFGIETHPKDVTIHERYYYHTPDMSARDFDGIDADDVAFFKIETDSDVKRGLPLLYSLQKPINQYDTWLQYRMALNKARAAIVLLRKHSGSPRQVDRFRRNKEKTETKVDSKGNDVQSERIYPGTKMDVPAGVEYEFKAPNVDAGDVKHDGRACLLQVAAGASIAEFMVSGDASNANFASTMVSESPAVKEFEMWQGDMNDHLQETARAWLETEVRKGRLQDGASKADITFSAPRIAIRDPLKHAKANQILRREGVKSVETWREEIGLDQQQEESRIERREEEEYYG